MQLLEYLRKVDLQIGSVFLREGLRVLIQSVIEAEVIQRIGASPWLSVLSTSAGERTTQRNNGSRDRPYATRVGELALKIPKMREGATSPPSWSPAARRNRRSWPWCRRHGMPTRLRGGGLHPQGGSLLENMGLTGIDKSEVSAAWSAALEFGLFGRGVEKRTPEAYSEK